MVQLDIFTVHKHETPKENEIILEANRELFSEGCKKVFDLLMAGGRHTVKEMDVDRARISDLKRNGVRLSCELKKTRYKIWFMTPEDIAANKLFIKS